MFFPVATKGIDNYHLWSSANKMSLNLYKLDTFKVIIRIAGIQLPGN